MAATTAEHADSEMITHHGVSVQWAPAGTPPVRLVCPNCGAPGDKPVLLSAQAALESQGVLRVRLLDCPACGVAFAEAAPPYDYATYAADALSIDTHVEAGAGLWPIVRTLARLTLPPGARMLEIGCGFGFGIDYAIRERAWQARGIDPSPLAASGRAQLGLPIESRYFGSAPGDQDVQADAILASEVVEHIADPPAFLGMLRRALTPAGVLVLTTPDRDQLRQDAPLESIVPILSVGAHLVLQTQSSLRALLARAGFTHALVEVNGAQLVAYASALPLHLDEDGPRHRTGYRAYLRERAGSAEARGTLWWGFAGRAYQEAVADSDSKDAAALWPSLRAACLEGFGFDPEHPESVPSGTGQGLRGLAALVPKALPALLYARALDRLHAGERLADVAGLLRATIAAEADLSVALMQAGAADLSAQSAARAARAALAALAADRGAPESLEALAEAVAADPRAALPLARRSFVGLVNAADLPRADLLRARWDLGEATLETEAGAQARDVLFCLGISDLRDGADAACAMQRFEAAHRACTQGDDLWWASLRGLCIAADRLGLRDDATARLRGAPRVGMPEDLRLRLGED